MEEMRPIVRATRPRRWLRGLGFLILASLLIALGAFLGILVSSSPYLSLPWSVSERLPPPDPTRTATFTGSGVELGDLLLSLVREVDRAEDELVASGGSRVQVGGLDMELRVLAVQGGEGKLLFQLPGPGYAGRPDVLTTIKVKLLPRPTKVEMQPGGTGRSE
ncbi:MAG: hypothetical protein QN198_06565 [Armatimonadota bacterium]|nr:hypothetical protein [Armatimonadota bacterium]MDR5703249.1 hypothetical protein [Armatimonadota bacterium]MDR7433835.1 hypothetical protein [Armatimonadota bacterium]